jgi:hypothetical protein
VAISHWYAILRAIYAIHRCADRGLPTAKKKELSRYTHTNAHTKPKPEVVSRANGGRPDELLAKAFQMPQDDDDHPGLWAYKTEENDTRYFLTTNIMVEYIYQEWASFGQSRMVNFLYFINKKYVGTRTADLRFLTQRIGHHDRDLRSNPLVIEHRREDGKSKSITLDEMRCQVNRFSGAYCPSP